MSGDHYGELHDKNPHIKITNEFRNMDIQIRALNRALNLLLSLLKYRGVITENEQGWIQYIKNDPKLAISIDQEGILSNFLDIASKAACPKNFEGSIALIRNHKAKGPPKKVLNPFAD